MTEQAKFTVPPLGKAWKKQTKTIKDEVRKLIKVFKTLKPEENHQDLDSIEGIFPNEMRSDEMN